MEPTQPVSQPNITPVPEIPNPNVEKSTSTPAPSTPLLLGGSFVFVVVISAMLYYVLSPSMSQTATKTTPDTTASLTTPTIATESEVTADVKSVDASIQYILDDGFADINKDLAEL